MPIADASGVKANSSRWLNRRGLLDRRPFRWRAGIALSASASRTRAAVERYIAGQGAHHARGGLAEELAELLRRHGVEHDERFLNQ